MQLRVEKLLEALSALGAEAIIVYKPENIRYFTGFTGEGYAFVSAKEKTVVTDSRYSEQARSQAPGFSILERAFEQFMPTLAALSSGIKSVAYEDDYLSVSTFKAIAEALPGVNLVSADAVGAKLREIKDQSEIDCLMKAADITDQVFSYALTVARPGISELDLVAELDYYMARHFKAKSAFDYIVAAGENGSMPHAIPGDRVMKTGDMVTLDFGAEYMGYKADMTRTFALGRPSDTMQEVYNIVHDAQQRAAEALQPGVACKAVDAIARDYIAAYGYGDNFGHGLGHGVGLEIHESPRLNRTSASVLSPGMVVTVEPGIYLPGIGGVRIEDTCLITETGWVSLFKSDKKLFIL